MLAAVPSRAADGPTEPNRSVRWTSVRPGRKRRAVAIPWQCEWTQPTPGRRASSRVWTAREPQKHAAPSANSWTRGRRIAHIQHRLQGGRSSLHRSATKRRPSFLDLRSRRAEKWLDFSSNCVTWASGRPSETARFSEAATDCCHTAIQSRHWRQLAATDNQYFRDSLRLKNRRCVAPERARPGDAERYGLRAACMSRPQRFV